MSSFGFSVGQITLAILISTAIGIIVGLWLSPRARQARQLADKLEQKQAELDKYQDDTTRHFVTTSEHFRELTTRYQQLFEHLRNGANELCSDERIQMHLAAVRVPPKSLLDAEVHHVTEPELTDDNSTTPPIGKSAPDAWMPTDYQSIMKSITTEDRVETV